MTVNRDPSREWRRSESELEVDEQHEYQWELNDGMLLAQAHQRLALVRAVTHWLGAVDFDPLAEVVDPRRYLRVAYASTRRRESRSWCGTSARCRRRCGVCTPDPRLSS